MRLLQGTEMTECPGYLVSVSFHISVARRVGAQYVGDVAGNGGFFGNANYHINFFFSFEGAKVRKKTENER